VRFARELLDVFIEAGWPAQGVYRASQGNVGSSGLFLAVKDRDYPPDEANWLLLVYRSRFLGHARGISR
jgi:hypothetical protein